MARETLITVLLAFMSVSWGAWMLSFAIGKWARGRELAGEGPIYRITQLEAAMSRWGDIGTMHYRVEQLEARIGRAEKHWSDLGNEVQTLPDKLSTRYITRNECEMLVRGPRRHNDEK